MRPTFAEINLRVINTNLRNIRKKVGRHPLIMAVVKANAYGHGVIPVVQSIRKHHTAQCFGVAIIEEAIELRSAGVNDPIHVFTVPSRDQLDLFVSHDIEMTLCDFDTAYRIDAIARKKKKRAVVHVKIDTGMGRIGISSRDAVSFVKKVMTMFPSIDVKGIWTHFATSDENDLTFAYKQLSIFRAVVTRLELDGFHIPLIHCANSGAIFQMPEAYFDMVRPGIMMYGYAPSLETKKTVKVQPALSLKAKVGFIKNVEKGTSISYGRRYIAKKKSKIASVTIGYADGYFRNLTNKSFALIKGKRFPVVGTICMDQIMIDVGSANIRVGDEVVLLGKSGASSISGWDIARSVNTIPYEVTCALSRRVPRQYIHG